jgi:hypothetical protein
MSQLVQKTRRDLLKWDRTSAREAVARAANILALRRLTAEEIRDIAIAFIRDRPDSSSTISHLVGAIDIKNRPFGQFFSLAHKSEDPRYLQIAKSGEVVRRQLDSTTGPLQRFNANTVIMAPLSVASGKGSQAVIGAVSQYTSLVEDTLMQSAHLLPVYMPRAEHVFARYAQRTGGVLQPHSAEYQMVLSFGCLLAGSNRFPSTDAGGQYGQMLMTPTPRGLFYGVVRSLPRPTNGLIRSWICTRHRLENGRAIPLPEGEPAKKTAVKFAFDWPAVVQYNTFISKPMMSERQKLLHKKLLALFNERQHNAIFNAAFSVACRGIAEPMSQTFVRLGLPEDKLADAYARIMTGASAMREFELYGRAVTASLEKPVPTVFTCT